MAKQQLSFLEDIEDSGVDILELAVFTITPPKGAFNEETKEIIEADGTKLIYTQTTYQTPRINPKTGALDYTERTYRVTPGYGRGKAEWDDRVFAAIICLAQQKSQKQLKVVNESPLDIDTSLGEIARFLGIKKPNSDQRQKIFASIIRLEMTSIVGDWWSYQREDFVEYKLSPINKVERTRKPNTPNEKTLARRDPSTPEIPHFTEFETVFKVVLPSEWKHMLQKTDIVLHYAMVASLKPSQLAIYRFLNVYYSTRKPEVMALEDEYWFLLKDLVEKAGFEYKQNNKNLKGNFHKNIIKGLREFGIIAFDADEDWQKRDNALWVRLRPGPAINKDTYVPANIIREYEKLITWKIKPELASQIVHCAATSMEFLGTLRYWSLALDITPGTIQSPKAYIESAYKAEEQGNGWKGNAKLADLLEEIKSRYPNINELTLYQRDWNNTALFNTSEKNIASICTKLGIAEKIYIKWLRMGKKFPYFEYLLHMYAIRDQLLVQGKKPAYWVKMIDKQHPSIWAIPIPGSEYQQVILDEKHSSKFSVNAVPNPSEQQSVLQTDIEIVAPDKTQYINPLVDVEGLKVAIRFLLKQFQKSIPALTALPKDKLNQLISSAAYDLASNNEYWHDGDYSDAVEVLMNIIETSTDSVITQSQRLQLLLTHRQSISDNFGLLVSSS